MVQFANQEFVDQANSRFKDQVTADIRENEHIKSLLTNLNNRYKIVSVGDIEIRVRVSVPRDVRDLAETVIGISEDDYERMGGITGVTDKLYELGAKMCLDSPYNDPATWYYLDEQSDGALILIRKILDESGDLDAKIYNFR